MKIAPTKKKTIGIASGMNEFTTSAIALLSRYSNSLLKKDSEAALSGEVFGDDRKSENINLEYLVRGLYRLNGSLAMQQNALNIIENAKGSQLKLYFIYELSAEDKASCIKTLLRKMPDTLFPHCQRVALLDLADMATHLESEERIFKALQILVYFIPETHKICLESLLIHLKAVTAHSDENKMDEANLSLLFSSYIFPVLQNYDSIEKAKEEIERFGRLFPILLKHIDLLFKLSDELVQNLDASLIKKMSEHNGSANTTFSPLLQTPSRNSKTTKVVMVQSCSKRVLTPTRSTTDLEVAKLAAKIASMEEGATRKRLLNKMMSVQRQKLGIRNKSILKRALNRNN
uniref:Rho-GAP domain-containing protein n=1 Tax=Globodera pallida TaxID=36090 RepID=A0A183BNG4_GLOPA